MSDLSAADWLISAGGDPGRLVSWGPPGFEAYGRLRYLPDPDGPGVSEADAFISEDHPSDLEQARTVLTALAPYTGTVGQCYFCVWDGYVGSFLEPELLQGPLVELPHRRYVLFAGGLGDIARWEVEFGSGGPCPPPAFLWPADRRWCFTSDVDPHWAAIGASAAAVDALTTRTDVDVVRAAPDRTPPAYLG